MLPLSLSYDHRVIDGADAARFLRWLVDALGSPSARAAQVTEHVMANSCAWSSARARWLRRRFPAADLGMQVTSSTTREPGGVCLYRGCIPSKALLHVAKLLDEATHASAWGIDFGEPQIDLDGCAPGRTGRREADRRPRAAGQAAQGQLRAGPASGQRRDLAADDGGAAPGRDLRLRDHRDRLGRRDPRPPARQPARPRLDRALDLPEFPRRCSSSAAATSAWSWARSTRRSARRSPSSR